MDIHIAVIGVDNCHELMVSLNELWISINWIKDIHNCIIYIHNWIMDITIELLMSMIKDIQLSMAIITDM